MATDSHVLPSFAAEHALWNALRSHRRHKAQSHRIRSPPRENPLAASHCTLILSVFPDDRLHPKDAIQGWLLAHGYRGLVRLTCSCSCFRVLSRRAPGDLLCPICAVVSDRQLSQLRPKRLGEHASDSFSDESFGIAGRYHDGDRCDVVDDLILEITKKPRTSDCKATGRLAADLRSSQSKQRLLREVGRTRNRCTRPWQHVDLVRHKERLVQRSSQAPPEWEH